MDRNGLLKLIHKDLNELQLLLKGMEGYAEIPDPIITLAKSKADQLFQNINELPGEIRVPLEALPKPMAEREPMKNEPEDFTPDPEVVEKTIEPPLTIDEPIEAEESDVQDLEKTEETIEDIMPDAIPVEPEIVEAQEEKVGAQKKKLKSIFGESIESGEKVFDRLKKDITGSLSAKLEGSPIKDLKRAININDRFMFQKELFDNDSNRFNRVVEDLNGLSSFDEALHYIADSCEWNFEDEVTARFMALVNRRFK